MHIRTWLGAALPLLAIIGLAGTANAQAEGLPALSGEWVFVEDLTPGRTLEQMSPPMNGKFSLKAEEGAIILVSGHGGNGNRNVRIALDGAHTDVPGATEGAFARYRASWKDGVLTYEITFVRAAGQEPTGLVRRDFRMTKDGLVVRYNARSPEGDTWWVGLYRQPKDIAMPTPAKAVIGDLAWLSGAWVGQRGATGAISIEERWSPPLGGSMLAVSRTVSRERLSAFEFLRIVEREGGLVYVAQPGGAPPTEFVLTELTAKRAVFENPRHDYPKRIAYELSEGGLSATVGYTKGGTPQRFEFKREGG